VHSVERLESALDVYNIEVHGEHVFRVTADGVLVHNACPTELHHSFPRFLGGGAQRLTALPKSLHQQLHRDLNTFLSRYKDSFGNTMSHSSINSGARIQANFSIKERLQALADFYSQFRNTYPTASDDFFRQLPGWLSD